MSKNPGSRFGWNFENSYSRLPGIFFSLQDPEPVRSPQLVLLNKRLAADLGLAEEELESPAGVEILAGNQTPEGATTLAQAYAGHQFGYFTMLGDGRALLLGEQITPKGERVDIQLKGAGKTPYSRGGDGRAALGPMLREYLISEAMHGFGIPTTRSLAVVSTGEPVFRETVLPGAILTRVAQSHIRVGTFQYAARWGSGDDLRMLADYTINRHFTGVKPAQNCYCGFLQEVIARQAQLIAKWQLVGFIHGVMNTDNMAISGETIDYGPCAFMDTYDPKTVFSSIDSEGRYCYENQPIIGQWNLARFAETLLPLLHEDPNQARELAQNLVSGFPQQFHSAWLSGMRRKLGIFHEEERDETLINELLSIMKQIGADYTNTFRALTDQEIEDTPLSKTEFIQWRGKWKERLMQQQETEEMAVALMQHNNPVIIPRNHQVEAALESAVLNNDFSALGKLLNAVADPYTNTPEKQEYTVPPGPSSCPYRTYCGT